MPLSTAEITQILMEQGAAKAIVNPERIRRDRVVDENFERGGAPREEFRRVLQSPYPLHWTISGSVTTGLHKDGARRVLVPSILAVIGINALTAPTGTLEVVLYRQPSGTAGFAATSVVMSLSSGTASGWDVPALELNANDWVSMALTSAGGAADVDIDCTLVPL